MGSKSTFIGCTDCDGSTNRARHDECVWCGSELQSNRSAAHSRHVHPASHAAAVNRADPTRTKTARSRFSQHLRARFDAIKWHIRRALLDLDVFGLSSPDRTAGLDAGGPSMAANVAGDYNFGEYSAEEVSEGLRRGFNETYDLKNPTEPELAGTLFRGYVETDEDVEPPTRAWAAIPAAEAVARFDEWLDSAMEREILEKYEGDTYVRQGYLKGVKNADTSLRQTGLADPDPENVRAVVRRPVHRDELERIYTQAYQSLDGITDAAANDMRRELAEGLARGENPRTIARTLNDRVENVGKTRGTVLARTEVIRAHSEASLTRFEQVAGNVSVTVKAEWLTAGDNRVCPECEALAGREFSISEARGMLPLHPQCRCAFRPIQKS